MRKTSFEAHTFHKTVLVSNVVILKKTFYSTKVDFSSQNSLLKSLAQKLAINEIGDWYNVTTIRFRAVGGKQLLQKFDDNLITILQTFYPGHEWLPWKFPQVSHGFWNDLTNQRKFFDWLGKQLGLQHLDDWYHVKHAQIRKHGGKGLLDVYDGSLFTALRTIFPEHEWQPWKFDKVPRKFWRSLANQRMFLEWIGEQLGIRNWTDWYQVDTKQISNLGGASLLHLHQESMPHMLSFVFPEHQWQFHAFKKTAKKLTRIHLTPIVEDLAHQLQISHLDEWYRVSKHQLKMFGASSLWNKQHSLYQVLCEVYPQHNWNPSLFASTRKKSSQRWLRVVLQKLFPNEEILEDYFHPDLVYKNSDYKMQLDIYLPTHSVAFEYQGQQHYQDHYFFGLQQMYEQKDLEKKIACQKHGIFLITIPFWWDQQEVSLAAIIARSCPKLGQFVSGFANRTKLISGYALANTLEWDTAVDPTGWWICEIGKGVRVLWNGNQFCTQTGQTIAAPTNFQQSLPKISLEGELQYCGAIKDVKTVQQLQLLKDWSLIKFGITDIPDSNQVLEVRQEQLQKLVDSASESIKIVPMVQCQSKDHINEMKLRAGQDGCEGIFLRKPGSLYTDTSYLLKSKNESETQRMMHSETLVSVVGINEKNLAIICKQYATEDPKQLMSSRSNGSICEVHCPSDILVQIRPQQQLRIAHCGHWKSGKLKHPVFVGVE